MLVLKYLLLATTALAANAKRVYQPNPPNPPCLTYDEAWNISTRWLSIFSTGGVTSESQLATIVAPNLYSVDDTFGPPTTTLDELWQGISAGGESPTTNVTQFPLYLIHSCGDIGVRWQYQGVTTGYNRYACREIEVDVEVVTRLTRKIAPCRRERKLPSREMIF